MNPRIMWSPIIVVATLLVASAGFALEEPQQQASPMQELAPESGAFWARVATFFGIEPKVLQDLAPELRREGVGTRDAVLMVVLVHKRTLRLLRGEKITKDELGQRFRDNVHDLLATRRVRANWKTLICDQLGVDLNEMVKQAGNSVREAMSSPSSDGRSAMATPAAVVAKEVPEDLYQPLLQRLSVEPESLRRAWGALESINQRNPRAAVILLVLAKEKTARMLEYRTAAPHEGERDKLFLDALGAFIGQVESRPRVGWGALASQVGVTSEDLHREAMSIILAAAQRQQQRTSGSGAQQGPLVPSELKEW